MSLWSSMSWEGVLEADLFAIEVLRTPAAFLIKFFPRHRGHLMNRIPWYKVLFGSGQLLRSPPVETTARASFTPTVSTRLKAAITGFTTEPSVGFPGHAMAWDPRHPVPA
ncbi:uncharacterized protein PG998_009016 [Apiospora kogelbergensis]|uniref:uncharacterized protein n=1 Tax=Apiospora kogelbergensis TaxID=1337665 RepID=UPI00313264C0